MSSLPALARLVTGSTVHLRTALVRAEFLLVLAALALPLSSAPGLDRQVFVGGAAVYVSDVLVALAVGSYFLLRLLSRPSEQPVLLRAAVLGWPLLAFALLLVPGIVRGHERFGASLVGQPARLVLYAGVALALTELRVRDVYRGVTAVFYAGTVWQLVIAGYHIATGTSQTPINELSTGGTRVLTLTTGMYLAGALVLALVNLELDRGNRRQFLHIGIAALATAGVALSYSRTTYLALLVVLPVLLWYLRGLRTTVKRLWPVWVAVLAAAVVGIAVAAPHVGTRLADRVTANPLTDHSVRWRARGIEAVLAGMKSGEWRPSDQLPLDPSANQLLNGGFEQGMSGWSSQYATLRTVPAAESAFGGRSLELVTYGWTYDEGIYSDPVVAEKGETWTFSIWLQGALGGERVNVSIWQYDDHESGVGQVNFPVTLSNIPTRYVLTTAITDPSTTHIRALVRTEGDSPQLITVRADNADLRGEVLPAKAQPAFVAGGKIVGPVVSPEGGWDALTKPLRAVGPNVLGNPGFESGTEGWSMQGGRLRLVPAPQASLGARSARIAVRGNEMDQGIYSAAVPAEAGQLWRFSIWLKGVAGDERVNVSIWEYDAHGNGLGQSNFPVTLSDEVTRYSLMARVTSPKTAEIRALVRTREVGRRVRIDADGGRLEQVGVIPASLASSGGASTHKAGGGSSFQIDEPLLGLGFGRTSPYVWEGKFYRVAGDPDNSYVFLLAGGGILALGGFLFLLGVFVRDLVRRLRGSTGTDRALLVWVLAMWFIVMVNCAMAPFLPRPKLVLTLWVLMLLPALVHRSGARTAKAE